MQYPYDLYATQSGNSFTLGNSKVEINLELVSGKLFNRSVINKKTGYVWSNSDDLMPICYIPGFNYANATVNFESLVKINEDGREYLAAVWNFNDGSVKKIFTLSLYDNLPAIRADVRLDGRLNCSQDSYAVAIPDGVLDINDRKRKLIFEYIPDNAAMISIPSTDRHLKLTDVSYFDATDNHDNFVLEHEREIFTSWRRTYTGNIFKVEAHVHNEAVLLVKEGPAKIAQMGNCEYDLVYSKYGTISVCGCGLSFSEPFDITADMPLYGASVIIGDKDSVVKDFHEYYKRGMSAVERYPQIVSNTWGDGNQDASLTEEFILKEVDAAEYLGVDTMQIDDGWQQGYTMGSAIKSGGAAIGEGMYDQLPEFWNVRKERFPNGLKPILEKAKSKGIKVGLWYACDATDDYKYYKKDIENILRLKKEHGVNTFKIDGMRILNKVREQRAYTILSEIRKATNNEIKINMDVTANKRFGYLMHRQFGNLFIENRYARSKTYYPHATLRNLWQLCKYIPSIRLQMECPNVKTEPFRYPDDDVLAPVNYKQDYAFAVTMFSSPLIWHEMQNLDPSDAKDLANVIKAYKPIRKDIADAYVTPIGEKPDGTNYTGFKAELEDRGYLLLFRGIYGDNEYDYNVDLNGATKLEILYKSEEVITAEIISGGVKFKTQNPKSFVLIKYSK